MQNFKISFEPDVSRSDTHSLCGRSDCHPLRIILCQRSYQSETCQWRDVIKPGGSRSSTCVPPGWVGGFPSPDAQQIVRMLDAETSWLNLATWPNNPNPRARTMLMILSKPDVAATVTFGMKSFHLSERILCWHRIWNAWTLAHMCSSISRSK